SDGPAAVGSSPPRASSPGRGITPTSVTIGVAVLDLSAVTVLGPEYDNGDVVGQWNALVADWRERHLLPINGRDVVLRFAKYGVTNFDEQRKACATLVDDDHAFAVVGIEFFYQEGADCVAREKRTPLLTSEGPTDEVFARSAPYLFSLQMSQSRLLRNFVLWADSRHALRGHRLGLYYFNDPNVADLMHRTIGAELAALGYPPAVEMTTNDRLGGPEDALAVQRFRSSKVDVAILFTSQAGFTQQAAGQGYHPTYLATDYEGATSDVGTNIYNGPEFDGTFAMTTLRRGEPAAGVPPTAEEEACVTNYERRSGRHVARPGQAGHETAEWVFVVLSCDEGKVLLRGLRSAGRDLSTSSFVAGLETVSDLPLIRYPNVTFGPDRHQGVGQQRPLRWHSDCTCWRAFGRFDPLFTQ
ncbi:MAG: type 1 periplasmic-binding domain-containing protein, partial [Acidimicrobiales bacterium]